MRPCRVKVSSGSLNLRVLRVHARLTCGAVIGTASIAERGAPLMADLAYAVLLIAGFLVLALTLRGLEKL